MFYRIVITRMISDNFFSFFNTNSVTDHNERLFSAYSTKMRLKIQPHSPMICLFSACPLRTLLSRTAARTSS